ncbi:MAG TPA: DUF4388 domain-containing protein [Candidatus Polarisedimenticolaceae bacterium]
MPLYGSLASMPLGDLLQWLGIANKTGTLELERQKVRKRILFRHGRVIACASEDPSDLLGHWLVSRGRISEDVLRQALSRQEREKRHLGELLVEMGAIKKDDLLRQLVAKTEESIFALFEWTDAEFRFRDDDPDPGNVFPVDLRVEDVLLRGAQRHDEVQRIRTIFNDPGIVLRRTAKLPPAEVFRNRMAKSLYEAVNGERSVAEILLHAHASEFLVTKFLFELHRIGAVEVAGVLPAPPSPAEDPLEFELHVPEPVGAAADGTARNEAPRIAVAAPAAEPRPEVVVPAETDLEIARRLMAQGDFDSALEILDRAYRMQPGDESLRRLLAEAESAFVEKAYRHYLPPSKIPVLMKPPQTLQNEHLSPAEFFLLSRMDGSWNVRSIIQIAPLREVEALRTLKRLRERGILELRDPA